MMDRITYGTSKVMWASSMVTKPRSTWVKMNSSMSEIPVTMSGIVMGMLFRVSISCCGRRFMA